MKNGFPILIFIFCLVTFQCEEHDPLKAECNLNNLSSTQLKSDRMSCWLPIETHPIYEYGQDSLKSYLESYLPGFKRTCFEGKVFIQFIVFENGETGKVEIIRGFGEPYDSQILQSLPKIPKFIPGRINNQPAKFQMIIPLKYSF